MKVFLRAFDEGRIADARGAEYSLSNVTVIATSNVVVDMDASGFGFHAGEEEAHRIWVAGLQDHFAPEFLNRFDEIVPVESLTVGDLGIILRDKILPQVHKNLFDDLNVSLQVNEATIGRLATPLAVADCPRLVVSFPPLKTHCLEAPGGLRRLARHASRWQA